MRNFDHIIWDWNGTLVDDTQLCLDILNEQLQQKKMQPLDIETYRDRFGFPLETFYRKIGISDTHEDFLEINRAFLKEYTLRRGICRLYEGVVEVLETFKNSGGQHSVLSAYTVDALREMVRMLGVDRYFLHIMGIDRHEADSKVSEGLALVKALGCAPGRILFVGDTTHDYETARISGTACILIASGHQNPQTAPAMRRSGPGFAQSAAGLSMRLPDLIQSSSIPVCCSVRAYLSYSSSETKTSTMKEY